MEDIKKQALSKVTVVKNMRDYSNDPVVLKKAQIAKEFIEKNGLPPGPKKKKQK
ncbi:MAG TPA: hypothetical protein VFX73_02300 [Chitinophagaceae bacterium]|nr:hypothetical protein [Chitinophagaceae bacterium]